MGDKLSFIDLDKWQQVVEAHPESTPFHHRNWLELLIEQYGFEPRIAAIEGGGQVLAAIPFLETRSVLGRHKLISLPFSDCVPLLAASDAAAEALCEAISHAEPCRYREIVLRCDRRLGRAASASDQVRHVIRIDGPLSAIRDRYSRSLRKNVRKAEKRLSFEWRTDLDAMHIFYRLQVKTRKRLGVPVQPKGFFERLYKKMICSGLGLVGLAFRESKPIAADVYLTYKRTMIAKYSASEPAALKYNSASLLVDRALQKATDEGFTCFDFGTSAKTQDGLRRFKSKWGAAESDVYRVYLGGKPRSDLLQSRSLVFLSFFIRHSPSALCRCLGEAFYRFIP